MEIKMIVTDLDGTLLRRDKIISDYTISVLNECKKKGMKIVFATARPERMTKMFREKIQPDYVISNNGATINCGDIVIKNFAIPKSIKDEIIALLAISSEIDCMTVEVGDCLFTDYSGTDWEKEWNTVFADFSNAAYADVPKISVDCGNISFLENLMQKFPELHLYNNYGETWSQIMCREATKMNGILYIVKQLGFTTKNIAAFGDDMNDLEMLRN